MKRKQRMAIYLWLSVGFTKKTGVISARNVKTILILLVYTPVAFNKQTSVVGSVLKKLSL